MKYNIRNNWISSFDLIRKNPVIIFPFALLTFFEAMALQVICFSTRFPVSVILNPITRKFFGERFLYYPANIILIPRQFYYAQLVIYLFLGVFLAAITVNIFKNIISGLPLRPSALIKNALKRYPALFLFGIVMIASIIFMQRADIFIFGKGVRFIARYAPNIARQIAVIGMPVFLFATNFILHIFLVLAVPIIVLEKKPFVKAFAGSVYLGFVNFFKMFVLLGLPFLVYFPMVLLRTAAVAIAERTFPEFIILVAAIGIVTTLFINLFIIVSVSQFLIDRKQALPKKAGREQAVV